MPYACKLGQCTGGRAERCERAGHCTAMITPAGRKFDEGKGGPWIKLTWAQVEVLLYAIGHAENLSRLTASELDDLLDVERQLYEQTEGR